MLFLNPYSFPPLVISILFLILGSAIYFKNKRSKINNIFTLIAFVTFWWQFSWFILFNTQNELLASILVKIGYAGIIFIPTFFYHFFLEFLGKNKGPDKYALYFLYGISFIFEIILFSTDFLIKGYYEYFWGFYPKAGLMHLVYLFFLSLASFRGMQLLFLSWKEKKQTDAAKAKQIKNFLIGLIIYFLAASDFLVNYGVEFYPMGFVFVFIFMVILANSISKYHLFEIRFILTELLVVAMAVISLIEALLFQEFWHRVFGFAVFILFCFAGYVLSRYTYREINAKEIFEKEVQKRTKELQESNDELKRWYQLTIGRELRMAELKDKIKEMEEKVHD